MADATQNAVPQYGFQVGNKLAWEQSFTVTNDDGTTYTAPSGCKMYLRAAIGTLAATVTGTATQSGVSTILRFAMTAAETTAALAVGRYDVAVTVTESGAERLFFSGYCDVLESANVAR